MWPKQLASCKHVHHGGSNRFASTCTPARGSRQASRLKVPEHCVAIAFRANPFIVPHIAFAQHYRWPPSEAIEGEIVDHSECTSIQMPRSLSESKSKKVFKRGLLPLANDLNTTTTTNHTTGNVNAHQQCACATEVRLEALLFTQFSSTTQQHDLLSSFRNASADQPTTMSTLSMPPSQESGNEECTRVRFVQERQIIQGWGGEGGNTRAMYFSVMDARKAMTDASSSSITRTRERGLRSPNACGE